MTRCLSGCALILAVSACQAFAEESRWEPNILRFQAQDKEAPPPAGAVLFIGSSSIVGWDVKKHFPEVETINRGLGGSQIADSTLLADRIVIPYKPRLIVLYAGDNDIAAGNTPEQVAADYDAFVAKVREGLPEVWIAFIAIKPSIARWELVEQMRAANALIRDRIEADPQALFIDIDPPMIGAAGTPRPELFKEDGLHLNEEGYTLWSSLLRPYLQAGKWVTTDSGLRYMDVKVGDGPQPEAGQRVTAHYVGSLEDGTKFDASRDRGEEGFIFTIGTGQVIKGWDEGLLSMRVGGLRQFVLPPALAYGQQGAPGVIPPNATLCFTVELVAVR